MKKTFLEKPPYDRMALTLASNIRLARLGRLMARKRDYEAQIRAIEIRVKALLSPRKRK
jgi:hypothetical protein